MQKNFQSQLFRKKSWVNILIFGVTCVILIGSLLFFRLEGQEAEAHPEEELLVFENNLTELLEEKLLVFQGNTLAPVSAPSNPEPERKTKTIVTLVTAYSSTEDQTDSTPFITASGNWVREGTVAANFLPFGTKIRLPLIYGDKVFVVEDRMHPRNYYQVDIWFPSRWQALNFGVRRTYIEILEG